MRPGPVSLSLALVLALVVGLALPDSAAARSLQDIERELEAARTERETIDARIAEATAALDELEVRLAELEAEELALTQHVARLRREVAALESVVSHRVRTSFMHGAGVDPVTVFLGSDDPGGALARAQYVGRLIAADQVRGEDLQVARVEAVAAEVELAAAGAALATARAEQEEVAAGLQADFRRAGEVVDALSTEARAERERLERIRLEEERRERERQARLAREREAVAAASRRTGSGSWACPLDQPRHFTNSWGAPRSGGRAHRGTDIMGPHGIPVRAITDGVWTIQRPGPSAGLWGILRANNGDQFWYMHLTSHTVGSGTRVRAGQQVGTNGSTGNAHPSAPHVHFEHHPGGGRAVNPYQLLRRVCG